MGIEFLDLTKAYDGKQVLSHYTESIQSGEHVAIMGESGRGKTTLLRLIMGLEQPDAGLVKSDLKPYSVVFQEDRLCEEATVLENLEMVIEVAERKEKARLQDVLLTYIQEVGLSGWAYEPVHKLSGGMKRRVAILRGIAHSKWMHTGALILDEPFKGLDDVTKQQVMQFVQRETQNQTVILVTHDRDEASFFCKRILVIE